MRNATIMPLLLAASLLCSCATVLPETDPEHQVIANLIRASVENSETTVKDPIRIEISGSKATADYTVDYRTAQQPWNPMRSTLVKKDGRWMVKESKSMKPWYYRYK
jgi:hypothetical protein